MLVDLKCSGYNQICGTEYDYHTKLKQSIERDTKHNFFVCTE